MVCESGGFTNLFQANYHREVTMEKTRRVGIQACQMFCPCSHHTA